MQRHVDPQFFFAYHVRCGLLCVAEQQRAVGRFHGQTGLFSVQKRRKCLFRQRSCIQCPPCGSCTSGSFSSITKSSSGSGWADSGAGPFSSPGKRNEFRRHQTPGISAEPKSTRTDIKLKSALPSAPFFHRGIRPDRSGSLCRHSSHPPISTVSHPDAQVRSHPSPPRRAWRPPSNWRGQKHFHTPLSQIENP